MPGPNSAITIVDGSLDFSGGVDSVKVTTIQSQSNPNGLPRNTLAWLINGSVRDGGISPRTGWIKLGVIQQQPGLFQGAFLYEPHTQEGENPYIVASISGNIWKIPVDNPAAATNLSAQFNLYNNTTSNQAYFCQAEQFLIIQSGDNVTLPLFWDGANMRRSVGLNDSSSPVAQGAGSYTVTIRNDTAFGGVKVTKGSMSSPVGGSWTAQIGPISEEFTVPAVGATVVVKLDTPYTGAIGAIVGLSCTNFARVTGAWTVTAASPDGGGNPQNNVTAELPAATAMDYYMGRVWYAQGRSYSAGDIVRGPSGTGTYNYTDSVLKVTENPVVIGGDGFTVPTSAGNIRALKHSASIDAALGQGRLFIFTRKVVYAQQVPVTRTDWINADSQNQPLQTVVQLVNGAVSDRSVVPVNGDLFYQSMEPGIRSLVAAVRNFQQWGNVEISANENRLLRFNDRSLMYAGSGIYFNDRLLQCMLPLQTPNGVVHRAVVPLDFIPISSFNQQSGPIWQGMYEGLNMFQILVGDFGGLERAFAITLSDQDSSMQLWEISQASRRDNVDSRITMVIETPAYTWGNELMLKELVGGEIWVDQLSGEVDFLFEYRPDSDSCWTFWHQFKSCSPANSCEDVANPICYPVVQYRDSYRSTLTLPHPASTCASATGRPSNIGYQFQVRLTIKGWVRVRGLWLHCQPRERQFYEALTC